MKLFFFCVIQFIQSEEIEYVPVPGKNGTVEQPIIVRHHHHVGGLGGLLGSVGHLVNGLVKSLAGSYSTHTYYILPHSGQQEIIKKNSDSLDSFGDSSFSSSY